MSGINVTISGTGYAGNISGNQYSKRGNSPLSGDWVYSNGFLYKDGSYYVLLVFNSDKTISYATSNNQTFQDNPQVDLLPSANWSGMLPSDAIDSARNQINSGEQELYRVRGSVNDSFHSSYQDTMLAGVLVAMLGASVLIYIYR